MEVVHEHPEKIPPLVGYFPSGFDPHKPQDHESDPPPAVKVNFVGTSYSGEAASAQVCTYALGVLDKETQTLKIVPIASNKIFRLEPRVGGSDASVDEPSSLLKGEQTAEEKAGRMRDLTNLYGTKKSITQAKKLQALNQKDDPRSQKDLDRKLKEVVINKEALESTSAHSARNIPPYDDTATTPQEAYPLDKIIFKGEWDYLLDILNLLHAGAEDEGEKTTLACIFSYINHLLKYKDRNSMDASSAKHHKIPGILNQKFSSMFALDSDSRRLTEEKKDLLISYVLVLTLYADEFRTDPSDIARDLRMSAVKLRAHFEHLGCKLVSQNKVTMATLPVPLTFPRLRQKRRR
ncbi:hypothetical protein CK203_099536 [Vitis vinifera]|uniref:DNA-directed RNA polymerase I subunit rpa49 n=2 Tax=Vitis vinifera TaxID=29760 RepID=A0A438EW16_VITVI|nr:hypothetical protein CK203_099536 [Vitis vinifera]